MHTPKGGYQLVGGAWIHPEAKIESGVSIEPNAVVGADVSIGRGCWIGAGAVLYGPTMLGEDSQVYPSAILGGPPQDKGYRGEPTRLVIGRGNLFREGVTINRGSPKGGGETRIGDECFFMSGSHIAHDCQVGDQVVLTNDVLIAGHCHIGSNTTLAGGVAIVQFTTVGRFAFVGGLSGTTMDVEPFLTHDGMPSRPRGVNIVGLRRGQFPHATINNLKDAFRVIFCDTHKRVEDLSDARRELERRGAMCDEVRELLDFMERSRQGRFGRQGQHHAPRIKLLPEDPAAKSSE